MTGEKRAQLPLQAAARDHGPVTERIADNRRIHRPHGSRGYGRVKFSDLKLCVAVGVLPPAILAECQALLDEG